MEKILNKIDKYKVLVLSFMLLIYGNAQFFIQIGIGQYIIYIGLGLLIGTSVALFYKNKAGQNNWSEVKFIILVGFLLSIGIVVQDLNIGKKIVLIASVLILTLIATTSKHIINDFKCVYACSIGIFIGIVSTFFVSLFFPSVQILQNEISFIGFTAGMEHKNYFAAAVLASFIGLYIYYSNVKKTKALIIVMCIEAFFLLVSSSKGAVLLVAIFLVCANMYRVNVRNIINKINIYWKIGIIVAALFIMIIGIMNISKIQNYNYRIQGMKNMLSVLTNEPKQFLFGISSIAHRSDDYVNNVRSYLGWNGTVEMSLTAIMIKGGIIALIGHVLIFVMYVKNILVCQNKKIKYAISALLITFLVSGLVETYIMNVKLVYCVFSYCVLCGLSEFGKANNN